MGYVSIFEEGAHQNLVPLTSEGQCSSQSTNSGPYYQHTKWLLFNVATHVVSCISHPSVEQLCDNVLNDILHHQRQRQPGHLYEN
jgi:hypothetical protein